MHPELFTPPSVVRHESLLKETPCGHSPSIVIISGPHGVGKGTILKSLLTTTENMDPGDPLRKMKRFTRYTTREKREGEVDGEDYTYIHSEEEFDQLIQSNKLYSWSTSYSRRYGEPFQPLISGCINGSILVLDSAPDSAKKLAEKLKEDDIPYIMFFLLPLSSGLLSTYEGLSGAEYILTKRMLRRGDTGNQIEARNVRSEYWLQHIPQEAIIIENVEGNQKETLESIISNLRRLIR